MALKWIIGDFINGFFKEYEGEWNILPVIKGSDGFTRDIHTIEEASFSVSKRDLKNPGAWEQELRAGKKMVALIDDSVSWNSPNAIIFAGLIIRARGSVKGQIDVKATGMREYLARVKVASVNTGSAPKPSDGVEFKASSFQGAIINLYKKCFSMEAPPFRAPNNYGTWQNVTVGNAGIKVFNSDAMSFNEALEELENVGPGNEHRLTWRWATSAMQEMNFTLTVAPDSVPLINEADIIDLDISQTNVKLTEFSQENSVDGFANRMVSQSKIGDEEADTGSDFTVRVDDSSDIPVLFDEFFNPGVELNEAQMTAQVNARLNYINKIQKSTEIEIAGKWQDWVGNVGKTLRIVGGNNIDSSGYSATVRIVEIGFNASNETILLTIAPRLPKYPKLPKKNKLPGGNNGKPGNNGNNGLPGTTNPIVPRDPENLPPPGTGIPELPPFETKPPYKGDLIDAFTWSRTPSGPVPSVSSIREINGKLYGIEFVTGRVGVLNNSGSTFTHLNNYRNLRIFSAEKNNPGVWKIEGELPGDMWKEGLEKVDDPDLAIYNTEDYLDLPTTGQRFGRESTVEFSFWNDDRFVYIQRLSVATACESKKGESQYIKYFKVFANETVFRAALNSDGSIGSDWTIDIGGFTEEKDGFTYVHYFPNAVNTIPSQQGEFDSFASPAGFFSTGKFTFFFPTNRQDPRGIVDYTRMAPWANMGFYDRGFWKMRAPFTSVVGSPVNLIAQDSVRFKSKSREEEVPSSMKSKTMKKYTLAHRFKPEESQICVGYTFTQKKMMEIFTGNSESFEFDKNFEYNYGTKVDISTYSGRPQSGWPRLGYFMESSLASEIHGDTLLDLSISFDQNMFGTSGGGQNGIEIFLKQGRVGFTDTVEEILEVPVSAPWKSSIGKIWMKQMGNVLTAMNTVYTQNSVFRMNNYKLGLFRTIPDRITTNGYYSNCDFYYYYLAETNEIIALHYNNYTSESERTVVSRIKLKEGIVI